jgi:hypothetical protein
MRKTSLILLGAAAGVAVTLIATPPRIALDGGAHKPPLPIPTGS